MTKRQNDHPTGDKEDEAEDNRDLLNGIDDDTPIYDSADRAHRETQQRKNQPTTPDCTRKSS